jgi:2-dehydro-3-deoxyphosphogluconate aldolase/(4S)-4-hydroxy-2-oxoglutarate aldolase
VVAVVRIDDPTGVVELARALGRGGVSMFEVTMTVPGALTAIETTVAEFGDEVIVGAGTVLDATTASMAVSAGASYIVSPILDVGVIETAHLRGAAAMPGCLTPTEIATAWRAGAEVVKLFPGRVATPGYFKDLKGPLPQVRMMPTGNVNLETAPQYIAAGAVAVGVGKALVDVEALRSGDWDTITERARAFRRAVGTAGEEAP